MKSLITVTDTVEAEKVIGTGCDIIDIKNPAEGSLGANFPWVIRGIIERVPDSQKTSVAVGDVPDLPGTVSLAAASAAGLSPDFVKIGLKGTKDSGSAVNLLKKCRRAVKNVDESVKVVGATYADYEKFDGISPSELPEIGERAGVDLVMVDTAFKDSGNLFSHMDTGEMKDFVDDAHSRGLGTALAGSLKMEDVERIGSTGADIFGVRGAVCEKDDRESSLSPEKAESLAERIGSID